MLLRRPNDRETIAEREYLHKGQSAHTYHTLTSNILLKGMSKAIDFDSKSIADALKSMSGRDLNL
jgi:hypothetical protein